MYTTQTSNNQFHKSNLTRPEIISSGLKGFPSCGNQPHIYRNSKECRPYYPILHAFEGEQFGEDFICDSAAYEHWFNSEAFFCVAAFAGDTHSATEIVSVVSMLLVTAESARALLEGKIGEEDLQPYDPNHLTPPVIYFSSLAAANLNSLIPLYKILLKDIEAYKKKYNVAPSWGFSIAATENGLSYLEHSGFRRITANNFLNRYQIVKIDSGTTRSKIWLSILNHPSKTLKQAA